MSDLHTRWPLGDGIGFVSLIEHMGNDLTVVNAARVSYGKRSETLTAKDEKLIGYLMRHSHGTPFEHVVFSFRVRAPLFVVQQWERHRIASVNEESGRYIELRPDFYIKDDDRWAAERRINASMAFELYERMLADGVAKEDARTVLPASLYKEFWWSVNARSLMNFLALRNSDHAQLEIRKYAEAIELIFTEITPGIQKAFFLNGRKAP